MQAVYTYKDGWIYAWLSLYKLYFCYLSAKWENPHSVTSSYYVRHRTMETPESQEISYRVSYLLVKVRYFFSSNQLYSYICTSLINAFYKVVWTRSIWDSIHKLKGSKAHQASDLTTFPIEKQEKITFINCEIRYFFNTRQNNLYIKLKLKN